MNRSRTASAALAGVLLVAIGAHVRALDEGLPMRASFGTYALDTLPRELPAGSRRVRCATDGIVSYRGTSLRFWMPAPMNRAFVPYVQRFEELVRAVATEVYGRPPYRLSHVGAYVCRRIRRSSGVISEHALGNAIDVRGFDFVSARSDQPLPDGAPPSLRRSFRVRVEDHWSEEQGVGAYHARFFARLRERLESEPDLFGVMLGPSFPGHRTHLHLDRAPWAFVRF